MVMRTNIYIILKDRYNPKKFITKYNMLHYILSVITLLILFFFAYVKLKYPFWSNQPVYHTYDFIRYLYKQPFIINSNKPPKNKYYDPLHVRTYNYLDCNDTKINDFVNIIQCFYISTDRILHTISFKDIQNTFIGQTEPSFISIYYDKQIEQSFDLSGSQISTKNVPNGCISSRCLKFWYVDKTTKQQNYTEMPIYFIDYLSVDRTVDRTSLYRKLLQTHQYNQRIENMNVQCSLIKKEIELFGGIVPFVQYNTMTYKLKDSKMPALPKHYQVIEMNNENMDLYIDFFYTNTDYCSKTQLYDVMVFPEVGNIQNLIKQKLLYVYCLKGREHVYGFYFFRDAKMYYEELEGNTLHCIGSIMNCLSVSIFYSGFLYSMRDIIKKEKSFSMLLFEDLGHNEMLLNLWNTNNIPVFTNKTAYYLYNFIYPGSPIGKKRVFILQ